MSKEVFFSYTRADSLFALKLATDLKHAGANVWLDQLNIQAGARWDQEITKALELSTCVLVLLSVDSINSNNVMDEVSYALDEIKIIIPIVLNQCIIPIRLRRFQRIDFIQGYDNGLSALTEALKFRGFLDFKLENSSEKERKLWEKATQTNTISSYQQYLTETEIGNYKVEASDLIKTMQNRYNTNKDEIAKKTVNENLSNKSKEEQVTTNKNLNKKQTEKSIKDFSPGNSKTQLILNLFKKNFFTAGLLTLIIAILIIVYFSMFYQTSRVPLKVFTCDGDVTSVAFSPHGKYIIAGAFDGKTRVWDLNGKQILKLNCNGKVSSVAFSPDGKYILTGQENNAKLWNLQGKVLHEFIGHTSWINSVTFSSDGKYVLTASRDSTARLWDTSGNMLFKYQADELLLDAVFSPTNNLILAGGTLWNIDGKLITKLAYSTDCEAFSHDAKSILTGSLYSVRIWDSNGILQYDINKAPNLIYKAQFSPNGDYIIMGFDFRGTAVLSDLYGNTIHKFYGGNNQTISSVAFSPNGKYLLTGSWDHTVKLWSVNLPLNSY